MLKSYGWGGARVYVVAHEILVSALGPLVLGFGDWGQGLTINSNSKFTGLSKLTMSLFLKLLSVTDDGVIKIKRLFYPRIPTP